MAVVNAHLLADRIRQLVEQLEEGSDELLPELAGGVLLAQAVVYLRRSRLFSRDQFLKMASVLWENADRRDGS